MSGSSGSVLGTTSTPASADSSRRVSTTGPCRWPPTRGSLGIEARTVSTASAARPSRVRRVSCCHDVQRCLASRGLGHSPAQGAVCARRTVGADHNCARGPLVLHDQEHLLSAGIVSTRPERHGMSTVLHRSLTEQGLSPCSRESEETGDRALAGDPGPGRNLRRRGRAGLVVSENQAEPGPRSRRVRVSRRSRAEFWSSSPTMVCPVCVQRPWSGGSCAAVAGTGGSGGSKPTRGEGVVMDSKTGQGVVVGVDGSDSALRAVRWAADEAVRRHEPLRLVTAFSWTDGRPSVCGDSARGTATSCSSSRAERWRRRSRCSTAGSARFPSSTTERWSASSAAATCCVASPAAS